MPKTQHISSGLRPVEGSFPEAFITMKQVATDLNIPYYRIVRAVKANLIPHHTLHGSKKYLRMSEVLDAIKRHSAEEG